MIARRLVLLAALAVSLASTPAVAQDRLKVVATFSILADFVRNVGGDRVELATLVGPNGDAHVFSPSPADARRVAEAKVVVVNGLGFEGWIDRLVKASGTKAAIVVATTGIEPRAMARDAHGLDEGEDDADHEAEEKDGHGDVDPHAWQSVANAKLYVANIRDALIKADPRGRSAYEANARAYLAKLDALENEVKTAIAKIPADRRKIITSHDAFGYFGAAYGIEFHSPEGASTESEASAADVARIIVQIREERIPAVFMENITNPNLMALIARETGARIGGELYSDALSEPGGSAATYIEMMRSNLRELAKALIS